MVLWSLARKASSKRWLGSVEPPARVEMKPVALSECNPWHSDVCRCWICPWTVGEPGPGRRDDGQAFGLVPSWFASVSDWRLRKPNGG